LVQLLFLILVAITACTPHGPDNATAILLFNGTGTSASDVAAVEAILKASHLDYSTVNSAQLNRMSEAQLTAHHLLIVPGGNFITMGKNLTENATANIHNAVQGGRNYLGICAGGLLAGRAATGSMDLASGVRFGFYAVVNQGVHKAAVRIACPGSSVLEQYWEDGPQFAGWGEVVGKYPDGTPAVVQGWSGKGWVVLCGVHPEAPENWRRGMSFTTPASADNAYARTLIDAALNRTRLRIIDGRFNSTPTSPEMTATPTMRCNQMPLSLSVPLRFTSRVGGGSVDRQLP
jgi:glutamine amidotransferase-like uncharacterized protein